MPNVSYTDNSPKCDYCQGGRNNYDKGGSRDSKGSGSRKILKTKQHDSDYKHSNYKKVKNVARTNTVKVLKNQESQILWLFNCGFKDHYKAHYDKGG
jgi:Zn-dependent alcohol dehydrogenase